VTKNRDFNKWFKKTFYELPQTEEQQDQLIQKLIDAEELVEDLKQSVDKESQLQCAYDSALLVWQMADEKKKGVK